MMRRLYAVPLLVLAMAVSGTPRALAQPADEVAGARELFREGSKLADEGSWEAARDRFERSLKMKRAALTLYNLGIAQQETGHLVDAIESFRAFLVQPVDATTQRYVEPVRAVIAQLEGRVARLEVDVHPAGLRGLVLRVDGHDAPPAPGVRRMDPGRHEIVAVAPGYCEMRQTTAVVEGALATVALTLAPCADGSRGLALPIALAISGLGMFIGGEIIFGIGARQGIGSPSDAGSARATMLAGNIVETAGALTGGIAIILLLTRATRAPVRAQKAAVVPWSSGRVVGVSVRF